MEQRSLLQPTMTEANEVPEHTLDFWRAGIEQNSLYQPLLQSKPSKD
jgi:hypothetical protein